MDEWKVTLEPMGRNPDTEDDVERDPDNRGGLVIYIDNDEADRREEFSRVAFVRRASKNPETSFDEQLDHELHKAEQACAALNRAAARELM